jgi:ABC-type branched-subunit amino acid transport system substrate-binding protein
LSILAVAFAGGCSTVGDIFSDDTAQRPPAAVQPKPGGTRVALILPLSASGKAGEVARSLKEAGELALFDTKDPGFVLVSKDTGGTPAGAQAAANQAIAEGAELLIGPLFAGSVRSAAPLAQGRGVPLVAFSTDRNVAGSGVYLLSFLPSQDVERIVDYAVKRRITRFAALIPRSAYGNVVEKALRQALAARRARLVALERYTRTPQGVVAPVKKIVARTKAGRLRPQAIFIPEGGNVLRAIGKALKADGLSKRVKLLGTGLWDEPNIGTAVELAGGLFAAPTPSAKQSFIARYRSAYGRQPPRIASLAYDAVSLAVALSRRGPAGQRYTPDKLTTQDGFAGVDGLFRLTPEGLNQRGLAILQVTPTGARVVDPAPGQFKPGGAAF